mgnify:CR=1 FL=1
MKLVHTLRLTTLAEGVSFLLLLGVAMPLKYLAGIPLAVAIAGWLHGILFGGLCVLLAVEQADRGREPGVVVQPGARHDATEEAGVRREDRARALRAGFLRDRHLRSVNSPGRRSRSTPLGCQAPTRAEESARRNSPWAWRIQAGR